MRGGTAARGLVALLSVAVAGYAWLAYSVGPGASALHPQMREAFGAQPISVGLHVFASGLTLLLGPLQFSRRLRAARPRWHRWIGRVYLGVGVLVGGVAGLAMTRHAFGGAVSQAGFALLALAWLASGAAAYAAARARDFRAHRRWMVRNYALAFAAVTLRLMLPASMAAGFAFETAYPLIAWACWLPNLLAAEAWLRMRG